MAATVIVNEFHGPTATPVKTNKTSGTVRFKNADNATVDLNDPMVIPTAGTDISYEKILRLNATGTFTSISNYKFYTDGANGLGTGVSVLYKKEGAYGTPIEPASTTAFGGTDLFTATSGAPVTLGTPSVTAVGDFGDFLTMILTVGSTASQGTTAQETLTFAWDEI